ncbi:MAG: 4Fe-4S binding protein [Defluviitaleaceae bacterium]|nr:4Fe-4S binding protein [Defluviitaleaceae bacterium]
MFCTPGLNCHSCPAAAVSCPVGALQLFFGGVSHAAGLYAAGFLLACGAATGRLACGYVCPMGFLQDLLYKIKTPKKITRMKFARYLKYFVLAVFVVVLPLFALNDLSGLGEPWFCKYICPSGTILGALPLLAANDFLRGMAGAIFIFKASLAACFTGASVFVYRFFCRAFCPLGAFYSLFNGAALVRMRCDKSVCDSCGDCAAACKLKIEPFKAPNAAECIRCGDCAASCAKKALALKISGTK